MNKLAIIKAKDLKPKMVFATNGYVHMVITVTVYEKLVEIETKNNRSGLIIMENIEPVIILGEV